MGSEPLVIRNSWTAVRDHARTYHDFTYVYPVISRRSRGLSIGINLNPDKACNFDCVYCEVDRKIPGKARLVDLAQVRDELLWLIQHAQSGGLAREPKFADTPEALTRQVRDVAFSGDGEPTMIHNFDTCVDQVVEVLKQCGLTETKIVLITDSAGLDKVTVRRGLQRMDANRGEIWAKLDAGSEAYFRTVNRSTIRFDRILANLKETARIRPIIIQSLFLKVRGEVMSATELQEYCTRLMEITTAGGQISEVHAYTIARPVPEPWATRLEPSELTILADEIRRLTALRVVEFP
jgi:wyosine [tRNA(Phe)-imidazoG37] synthetase (radical SAM superfamily)